MCFRHLAVAFLATVLSPLLLECTTTCQMGNQSDYAGRQCPVKLTSVRSEGNGGMYFECVKVQVWMKARDFSQAPRIEIRSESTHIIKPNKTKNNKKRRKNYTEFNSDEKEIRVWCHQSAAQKVWEVVHDCIQAEAEQVVSVSYSTASSTCSVNYTVPGGALRISDPIPNFDLSVNHLSKSINVTVEPGERVYTSWCYKSVSCNTPQDSPRITIDLSQSRSSLLRIPYLLPCVCVEVYYTYTDARRRLKCPFRNSSLTDARDVWLSSEVTLFESSFTLSAECPASDLKVSASLCWRQHEHLCTPVLNSTLEGVERGQHVIYNTSALDRHPRMCVRFSLKGSHNVSCPFQPDMSSWEVDLGLGRKSVFLYLSSSAPAKFSAQLCVLTEMGCTPLGLIHSVTMEGSDSEMRIDVPAHFLANRPCVQVWQSDPALCGRRILCPHYTHNRFGIYAVAALIFVVIVALLGIFIHHFTKNGWAGQLCIQKPVLLVCSSEQSAHVSAVCALASILQGELSATVHMALWSQTSQTLARSRSGVADLGPLPWLYGQWEAVRKAQGKVLIIWSPEATETYERWREKRADVDENKIKTEEGGKADGKREKISAEEAKALKLNGKRLGKWKKEEVAGNKDCVELCGGKDCTHMEPSAVIAPVFTAALACLEGALQGCKGQGVAFVYFQGLCHNRDIPKSFRGIPRYCLPQEFRGLIQELGSTRKWTKTDQSGWHCWPRLISKVLSVWLARRLAQRLQTLLPQTRGKKRQGPSVTSSMSDKTQSRLKLPPASNTAGPDTLQEHEPLRGSPWREERL